MRLRIVEPMRMLMIALVLCLSGPAFAVEPDEVLEDPVLEERAREISKELRCLVCQNQDIDSSNAGLAKDLRVLVRERLVAGDSDEEVIAFVLEDFGIPAAKIDTGVGSSFESAGTTFTSWGLTCNGAFWYKQPREKVLAILLSMCHSTLVITDKIELHVLSKTSQKTLAKARVKVRAKARQAPLWPKRKLRSLKMNKNN